MEFCVKKGQTLDFHAQISVESDPMDFDENEQADVIMSLTKNNFPSVARGRQRAVGEHSSMSLVYGEKMYEDTNFSLLML